MKNRDIDCVGDICPVPLIKAKINYKKISKGESITIVTDHSCSGQSIKEAFKPTNASIKIEEEEGIWYITITKG
ncbi:sulfurtransferase TusA family protein [Clostridium amazonitimonense]|uniref:sulfurtransferase TusA family protein n=1 Tax=Clostridium amazonitimonense TaxID=1499689 RepID=UPI000509E57C|nr:sulfurtransferase TusA family protein [Clostridium amazonitimonense]